MDTENDYNVDNEIVCPNENVEKFTPCEENEFALFGQVIANNLKAADQTQSALASNLICTILYHGELKNLSSDVVKNFNNKNKYF